MPTFEVIDAAGAVHEASSYDAARRLRARTGGTIRVLQPEVG